MRDENFLESRESKRISRNIYTNSHQNRFTRMVEELIEKLKVQIIETLNLDDLEPADINAEDPLFGDDGIGLDSIDALELIVLMNKEYEIQIADPEEGKTVFHSIKSMAEYIQANS